MPPSSITRFAPSPTGHLHIGHAYAALFAAAPAERFHLRIEDIDASRCRPEYEAAIAEDLAWLGLRWEQPVRRQSEHFDTYRAALTRVEDAGLLYPCFCTRADIQREISAAGAAPHADGDAAIYPGTCRSLSVDQRRARLDAGKPYALRLAMEAAVAAAGALTWIDDDRGEQIAAPRQFGDVILARKDTPASYHLACTVDDAIQGITLVTRGEDLFDTTHIHRLLQAVLGLPTPRYRHHRILVGPDGRKFSKRDRAPTLRAMRAAGKTPEDVRAEIEMLLGSAKK